MALDAQARAVRRCRRSVDRLDLCTERIALVLGPDSVLAIARYVGKPAAAWTGDHAANFYRTSFGTNRTRARISRMGCIDSSGGARKAARAATIGISPSGRSGAG